MAQRNQSILVNRGWVPETWRQAHKSRAFAGRSAEELKGITATEIEGVVVNSEKPSYFMPENHPDRDIWFWVDIPAIVGVQQQLRG